MLQNPPDVSGPPAKPAAPPPYIWPFPTKVAGDASAKPPGQFRRVDQGWDLQNADWSKPGDVYAIADGTVTDLAYDPNGFGPSYPVLTLKTPSPYGPAVYYGHTIATVAVNTPVKQGDVIATTSQGGQGNAAGLDGWLEIGWWNNGPVGKGGSGESVATTAGQQMKNVLINAPTKDGSNTTSPTDTTPATGGGTPSKNDSSTTDPNAPVMWTLQLPQAQATADLDDPRNNLPFSAFFLGQQIVGGPMDRTDPVAGRGGSLTVQFRGGRGPSMPGVTLIRGAIAETQPYGTMRPRGPFVCYFMMNPCEVDVSMQVDTSGIASPFTQSQALQQSGATYPLQNQSVTFTLMFNRMYEVWQNNMVGPSQLGVRWDIRALERLMGIYDAQQSTDTNYAGSDLGGGAFGAGNYPPQSIPIQVILGGPNSIQFQGVIVTMEVKYTIFSADMIPVEASVDLGIMRMYQPSFASAKLLNIMDRGNFLQKGKPVTGLHPGVTFDTNPGVAFDISQGKK